MYPMDDNSTPVKFIIRQVFMAFGTLECFKYLLVDHVFTGSPIELKRGLFSAAGILVYLYKILLISIQS